VSAAKPFKGHLPVLDGVRGLAVLAVMLYHFRAADLPQWLMAASGLGWCGVDLFFVLSGFLITGILLDTREAPRCLPVFWMRRLLRIFPLYFVALAVLLAVAPSNWLPAQADQRYYWLYLNNWLNLLESRNTNHVLGHFWSLAVEEQFYMVWPLVVWSLPARWTLRVAASGILLALVGRGAAVLSGIEAEFVYRNTLLRADALLAGALCASLARVETPQCLRSIARRGLGTAAFGVAAVVGLAQATHYQNPWIQMVGYPLLWFGFGCFVLECALWPERWRCVAARPLRQLGKYSYGLYVWHWPVACAMLYFAREWSMTGWLVAGCMQAIGFICSSVLAWTSYRFLEEPMLRLKRYFTLDGPMHHQTAELVFLSSSISAGTTSKRSPTIP